VSLAELTGSDPVPFDLPAPCFAHLQRMTDGYGLWEHAAYSTPRIDHGFCTDDNARALIVLCREPVLDGSLSELAERYLRFVLDARRADGRFHNRRHADGSWLDEVGSDDSQGRAWWALGTVARLGPEPWMRMAGTDAFQQAPTFRSPHLRANAFAALGAAEALTRRPDEAAGRSLDRPDEAASRLLERTVEAVAHAVRARSPWPEARLTYDNARLPEALLAGGAVMDDQPLVHLGLDLLRWLVAAETNGDRFSFVPVGGWAPGEPRPGYDQQPVEAIAMVEACARAWRITDDTWWRDRAELAIRWFLGANDGDRALYDHSSGGCADGLEEQGVNFNRGAESTLAALAALQFAADL
jgi:hypothetical protein